jgi:hypothetical protein
MLRTCSTLAAMASPRILPFAALAALLLTGLGLAGCYASPGLLLDPTEAVQPLAEGDYIQDGGPGEAGGRFRLIQTADGWYEVETLYADGTIGETHRALVNLIATSGGGSFAIAEAQGDGGYAYAVARLVGGRVQLATPDCADPADRDLAVDHGGGEDDDGSMTPNCSFHNRVALLAALAAFAGQADFGRPYIRH